MLLATSLNASNAAAALRVLCACAVVYCQFREMLLFGFNFESKSAVWVWWKERRRMYQICQGERLQEYSQERLTLA